MTCNEFIYDIIVIGGGLSGLISAYAILNKVPTLEVIVLEAKDRIGGRILSVPVKVSDTETCLFDVGAHWVSSSQTHMMDLLSTFNISLVPQQRDGKAVCVFQENNFVMFDDHPTLENSYAKFELNWFFAMMEEKSTFYKFATVHNNNYVIDLYDSITMEQFIVAKLWTKSAKNVARKIVRTTSGIEPNQISVLYYLLLCNTALGFTNQYMNHDGGGREFWIYDGASTVCNKLEEIIGKINIFKNEPVTEISQLPNGITVLTSSGRKFICNYIICAVPPEEILKINFKPPLNNYRLALLQNIRTGHVAKFIITYNTSFWRTRELSGEMLCCDDDIINLCYDITKDGHPALTGFIKKSCDALKGEDGSFRDKVIEQLSKYWGDIAKHPIDYVEKSWWDEPFVGGCPMSCFGLGSAKLLFTRTEPFGKIHWAGAETATEWNGYMNGAIQSGFRVAVEILYEIRPQCLTYVDIIYIQSRRLHKYRLKNPKLLNKYTVSVLLIGGYFLYKFLKPKL